MYKTRQPKILLIISSMNDWLYNKDNILAPDKTPNHEMCNATDSVDQQATELKERPAKSTNRCAIVGGAQAILPLWLEETFRSVCMWCWCWWRVFAQRRVIQNTQYVCYKDSKTYTVAEIKLIESNHARDTVRAKFLH